MFPNREYVLPAGCLCGRMPARTLYIRLYPLPAGTSRERHPGPARGAILAEPACTASGQKTMSGQGVFPDVLCPKGICNDWVPQRAGCLSAFPGRHPSGRRLLKARKSVLYREKNSRMRPGRGRKRGTCPPLYNGLAGLGAVLWAKTGRCC